jgi:hypothetical protein
VILTAPLRAHPSTPNKAVCGLEVEVRLQDPGVLTFHYLLVGDLTRIRVPPSTGAGERADNLWEHTCFEAFVATEDTTCYHEFNFSPSLDWALYRFSDYRHDRSTPPVEHAPRIHLQQSARRLELSAMFSIAHLPEMGNASRLRFALAAVIEDERNALSFWALRHAAGVPDFHTPPDPDSKWWVER